MENTIYRLIEPKKIEAIKSTIDEKNTDGVIVRPTYMSICHADQRYFQGKRDPEVLKKKLPMALIHESIGEVVCDPKGEFAPGERVVMVPNTPFGEDPIIGSNYLKSTKFRASGFDGFMQTYVEMRRELLVRIPEGLDDDIMAFLEICSVDTHIIDRFDRIADSRRDILGVWGEGNMGYITSLFLKYRFPQSKVIVFGVVKEKLKEIAHADAVYNIGEIPEDLYVDHAFECVGGAASGSAVNQIINDVIRPEGTIALTGVSEENVPIHTRNVLEKGLRLFGSSRSTVKDFETTIKLYIEHPEVPAALKRVVGKVLNIDTIEDIYNAFDEDLGNPSAKTVMRWGL